MLDTTAEGNALKKVSVPTGFLLIDKPENITSFQCVNHIKKILIEATGMKQGRGKPRIKIGHAGTLDPFATGLLIICIGRDATKKLTDFLNYDKKYLVKAKLGELTDTLDKTGNIERSIKKIPTKQALLDAIDKLGSEYIQIPPIYSALKHKGKPLYKLAREKKQIQTPPSTKASPSMTELSEIVEKKSRKVKIYQIEFLDYKPPFFSFNAHVSKGTYIRSLANDIAKMATPSTVATTYELRRTDIEHFSVKNATPLFDIKNIDMIKKHLIQI